MKFKTKTKDCHLVVKAKSTFGEYIDEKELDRFARIFLRGFLRPKLIKKNLIEYAGPVGVSIYERLKTPMNKRDFFFILEQIVVAVQKLQANSMPINNLLMDIQYAYINEVTKEVQFIYLPVTPSRNGNIIEFIESVIYSVKPSDEKDTDYVSRFAYFFKSLKPFDLSVIERYIEREDRSVVNTIKKQNAGQSGFMTNKQQHYYEHYDKDQDGSNDDEQTGLLEENDDEATGLLYEEKTDLLFADDEVTGLLNDDEATGLLFDDNTASLDKKQFNLHFPTLLRVLTDETINVNKPVFRLGKERSYVDYFVTNNVAVSRSHADIITRENAYFVKDLNSKNHTYINDQQIPVEIETEIHNGDRLKLGNEEFVFSI